MAVESVLWQYWSSGWTDASSSSPNPNHAAIGPGDGSTHYRTCMTINLGALGTTVKRNRLDITLELNPSQAYGQKLSEDTLYARWYTAAPSKGNYNPQGTLKQTVSKYMDFGTDDFYVSFSVDISSLNKSAQTIYIYLTSQDTSTGNYHIFKFKEDNSITEVTAADVSAVITGSITNSSAIYKPTGTVTVSWDAASNGTNNTVTGYKAYLRYGSAPSTSTYDQIKTGLTSTSHSFSISDATRGQSVYAGVLATGSQIDGSIKTKQIGTINNLPAAPTYTASGIALNTLNKITYTVTAGNDADSQTTTLYYSLNSGSKTKFTSPLDITTSTTGVVSGSNSIVFYTYDTKEYSSASTSHTFTATFKPVIGNVTVTHTEVKDMNDKTSTGLASAAKIEFTMSSGTPNSIKLYVRTGTSSALSGSGTQLTSGFNYNQETKTISIPSIAAISAISAGNYYQFAFKVNDGTSDSDLSDWTKCVVKRKPKTPILPSMTSYNRHNDSSWGATAISDYYKDKVTINYTHPSVADGCAKITSLVVLVSYGTATPREYSCTSIAGANTTVELDLSSINANVSTSFSFKITDAAGQTVTSDVLFTLKKSSSLAFGGTAVNVTNSNLKPLTNTENFQISHPIAQASGTSSIVYKYYIRVGSNEGEITTYTTQTTTDQVKITITATNINTIAKSLAANQNSAFDTIITVMAADGFADTVSLPSGTFKVNFTESPYFIATNPQFKIKHDYYTNNATATTSMGTEITSSSDLNLRMINSGEGIVFVLPKADDPNKDIKEYQIYLARNDFTGTVQASDAVEYNQLLTSISYDDVLKNGPSDDNYYYYRYTASTYTKNEYFYFKVRVVDKTGNTSNDLICPNYLIGCRTVAPTFSAGNVRVDRNGSNVTLNYNFIVTDLGGSATKNGWTESFYNNYPNFERSITNYTPKATLVVEIAPNQDFKTEETISNKSNPIVFTPGSGQKLYNFTSQQTKLSGFSESHTKIFIRFTMTVSYGLKTSSGTLATITSTPQVYSYFGSVPTVAHRAHKVGINTNSLEQDDVFVVENYQGTKYVVFKGTDPTNAANSYEVRIDLLEGKLYGYKTQGENKIPFLKIENATIDGGSW